ncbi:hypothetical protein SprV_0702296500 [Sparganum proliferum]
MSKQAPPIMRKLLIGQLRDLCVEPAAGSQTTRIFSVPAVAPGSRLLFSLVWLQGRVMAIDPTPAVVASSSLAPEPAPPQDAKASIRCLLLDDGTDSVLVDAAAASAKANTIPRLGDYVAVIGELRSRGQDGALTASLHNWQVEACCLMSLSHADKYSLCEGQQRQKQPSVFAELSWPLEVLDMSRHFFTPA